MHKEAQILRKGTESWEFLEQIFEGKSIVRFTLQKNTMMGPVEEE